MNTFTDAWAVATALTKGQYPPGTVARYQREHFRGAPCIHVQIFIPYDQETETDGDPRRVEAASEDGGAPGDSLADEKVVDGI